MALSDDSEPETVSIEAFGHTFREIATELAEDLRSLEREGTVYSRFANRDKDGNFAGTFTRNRIKLTPGEIVEYVEAHLAMQQFEQEYERTGDFSAAILGISDERFRKRVVEYADYGRRQREELGDLRGCLASFLGPKLEALTCGAMPDRYERLNDEGETLADHREGVLRALESIAIAARRLSDRAHGRPPFVVEKEYDVQDLTEIALRGAAIDVVREEWTPKRAGSAKRIDLVVPSLEAVIECKIVRDKSHARSIADELRIDFECYHDHPSCKTLYAYIYDPARHISDPVQFCRDLNGVRRKRDHEFNVEITIGV